MVKKIVVTILLKLGVTWSFLFGAKDIIPAKNNKIFDYIEKKIYKDTIIYLPEYVNSITSFIVVGNYIIKYFFSIKWRNIMFIYVQNNIPIINRLQQRGVKMYCVLEHDKKRLILLIL